VKQQQQQRASGGQVRYDSIAEGAGEWPQTWCRDIKYLDRRGVFLGGCGRGPAQGLLIARALSPVDGGTTFEDVILQGHHKRSQLPSRERRSAMARGSRMTATCDTGPGGRDRWAENGAASSTGTCGGLPFDCLAGPFENTHPPLSGGMAGRREIRRPPAGQL
jgi:hypothetical protein